MQLSLSLHSDSQGRVSMAVQITYSTHAGETYRTAPNSGAALDGQWLSGSYFAAHQLLTLVPKQYHSLLMPKIGHWLKR